MDDFPQDLYDFPQDPKRIERGFGAMNDRYVRSRNALVTSVMALVNGIC